MPWHVSSWTPAACEDLEAADEPAELEEDAELLIEEEEEDPSGWSVSQSTSGRLYYWQPCSRRSVWHLPSGASARKKKGRRKRKKRRKRRLPRTSSLSSTRRLRQWHMQGWFCWFLSYAVSPSFGGRPKLPSFMDGMDKMDSFIARRRSRQWQAGLAGFVPRAVFSFPVVRPKMRCIMAGMDQKDSSALFLVSGIACVNAPRAVFSSLVHNLMMLRIMAGMLQNDSCPKRTGKLDYVGDDVVYFYVPLYLEVGMVSVFSTLLGSTADACLASDSRILRSILFLMTANCGLSAFAVHRCRRHLCHGAQADSHGR